MYLTDNSEDCPKTLTPIHEEMEIPSPVQFINECDTKKSEGNFYSQIVFMYFVTVFSILQKIISNICGAVFHCQT